MRVQVTETLTKLTCFSCGILYAVPEDWRRAREREHGSVYCPSGHRGQYVAETEEERLRKLATSRGAALDQARANEQEQYKKILALEHEAAKAKKRVGAGTCPCCKRTFKQLAAHMKCKHPAYTKDPAQ